MTHITGGRVSYGRTVQPAQFESKRADVELTFTLAEGEDLGDTLETIGDKCKIKVNEMLGKRLKQEGRR